MKKLSLKTKNSLCNHPLESFSLSVADELSKKPSIEAVLCHPKFKSIHLFVGITSITAVNKAVVCLFAGTMFYCCTYSSVI
ncbi:hypothetical protein Csa_014571 [Cucumis sativus]|uniref:Uncharacterized protein n=1 Tax=Cucumis sativus TaxID=3659 RepID=A0A0A0KYW2_CUCSA|nr:hypothetical protein Csa_014571 [Cucumis sativus]